MFWSVEITITPKLCYQKWRCNTCLSNFLRRNTFGWLSNDAVYNVLDKNNVGSKAGESLYRPKYASFHHFSNILRLDILRPDVVF